VGTISINPADDRLIIFNVDPDTTPQNTLDPIDSVINPQTSAPSDGLDSSLTGQRYLLTQGTGNTNNMQNPLAWQGTSGQPLLANANDIIEYNGTRWVVVFDSQNLADVQYVTNLTTGIQYKWTSNEWVKSIDGLYAGGSWNLIL